MTQNSYTAMCGSVLLFASTSYILCSFGLTQQIPPGAPPVAASVGACVCLWSFSAVALIKCSHQVLTIILPFSLAAQWVTWFKPSDIDPSHKAFHSIPAHSWAYRLALFFFHVGVGLSRTNINACRETSRCEDEAFNLLFVVYFCVVFWCSPSPEKSKQGVASYRSRTYPLALHASRELNLDGIIMWAPTSPLCWKWVTVLLSTVRASGSTLCTRNLDTLLMMQRGRRRA